MKILFMLSGLWAIVIVVQSCDFERQHKDVDVFYTTKSFGDIPTTPLLKPLTMSYDNIPRKWYLEVPHYFKQQMTIDSITEIGVVSPFIYGKIFSKIEYDPDYKSNEYKYVSKYNTMYTSIEYREPREDQIQIHPQDSLSKKFLIPERYFVINVFDSTIEAFFSEAKYKDHLKENGLSGKMYNIDSIDKKFIETGILPWFPDSIKVKLKK